MTDLINVVCFQCEGKKSCTSCGGTGLVDRMDLRMTCAVYAGSGQCLLCDGSGEVEGEIEPALTEE